MDTEIVTRATLANSLRSAAARDYVGVLQDQLLCTKTGVGQFPVSRLHGSNAVNFRFARHTPGDAAPAF
jgi:hypothetical protein